MELLKQAILSICQANVCFFIKSMVTTTTVSYSYSRHLSHIFPLQSGIKAHVQLQLYLRAY